MTLHNHTFGLFSGRGKGRGRSRNEEEEEGAGGRPSGPSTLFDFLESKMGVFSIDGGWTGGDSFPNYRATSHMKHQSSTLMFHVFITVTAGS